ncbi:probable tRNA (uracil-O(2)-)-methyltransferase [Colias croceus]|uniref:probable tRNA (uracil-O(2)-)-methyltransferase n=1 Tax=Colias crocea TaxID=72248 RepID=UPI001E27F49C|nr:probable tRNA (uracil-O(2)-)-methyltransferase [Colias croceus]
MIQEIELDIDLSKVSFWASVQILLKKPHVVNKRVWGSKILETKNCIFKQDSLHTALQNLKLDDSCNVVNFFNELHSIEYNNSSDPNSELELILIELFPKCYEDNHAYQLVVLDEDNANIHFYDVTCKEAEQNICPNFPYSFTLKNKKLVLKTYSGNSKSTLWLKDVVLKQIVKWAEETDNDKSKSICTESLSLIDTEKYYVKYNDLKIKYGKELVKIWPECTDPAKFVYEDIAIATYLLLLWESDTEETQYFVDVGCGNGLLVYILTMEGHSGTGVDVRKRKIWDMYPKNIELEEKTITPSDIYSFPEATWIIGNHSDELTPWIPVIAACSSYKCRFFLLPCCAFNFDGTKYKRHDSSKSQYTEYLENIKSLCDDFGFQTQFDRLKIPSTKRISLIGQKRIYEETEYSAHCVYIQKFLDVALRNNEEAKEFKTREKVERVRNCTQIDKTVIDSIIIYVTSHMLKDYEFISSWSTGKQIKISDIVKLIPDDMLKMLKSECGGLQTLLRNNHHIFQIVNGKVQFRYPKTIDEVNKSMKKKNKDKNIKMQVKRCWFFDNHPQGCPLDAKVCSFLHVLT